MPAAWNGSVLGALLGVLSQDGARVASLRTAKRYGEPERFAARVRPL
jgi:hypothetical protein